MSEARGTDCTITIWGTVASTFDFSHESHGERFYLLYVDCERLSGAVDTIPVLISDKIVDVDNDKQGETVFIAGDIRTHNIRSDSGVRLSVFVFAAEIEYVGDVGTDEQSCYIKGYVCRDVKRRLTSGGREIGEVMIAVNRPFGKSEYIPCICWGRNAKYAERFNPGDLVELEGRFQSREYIKRTSDGNLVERVAYEVSAKTVRIVKKGGKLDERRSEENV